MINTDNTVYSADLLQFLDTYMAASNSRLQQAQAERDALDVRSGVYNDLKTKLRSLRSLVDDLKQTGTLSPFGAHTAESSNTSVLTATASAGALSMSHTIHVDQLARAHSVVSDRITADDTDLSAAYAGTKSFSITVGGDTYDVSVEITAGDTNEEVLEKIATAVNDTDDLPAGASRIADSSSTAKLSIFSSETGLENKLSFTDTDGLLAAVGIDTGVAATDTTGGYIYADEELDASLTVDGIAITSSSNSVTDVLTGVTLELNAAQLAADADVNLDVSVDTDTIKETLQEFLTAYNDAFSYLRGKISVDPTTYVRGDLAGDYPYVNLWQNMRVSMASTVSDVGDGAYSALSQIGIRSDKTGTFSIIDSDALDEALANDLESVESLFSTDDGIATRLEALLDEYTAASGVIHTSLESISDRSDLYDDKISRLERMQEMERTELIKQYSALQEASYNSQSLMSIVNALNGM